MSPQSIENNIDVGITRKLFNGQSFGDIILYMEKFKIKIKSKTEYKETPKSELLRNWKNLKPREKYAMYFIIHYNKRLKDLNWIIMNKHKLPELNDNKLFNLILFKENLKRNKRN